MRQSHDHSPSDGLIAQIALSILSAAVGAILLFAPNVRTETLCCILCAVLILAGIIFIFRFFQTQAYKKLYDYRFSSGVLLVLLGVCGLIRVYEMALHLEIYMGVVALALGIVILQSAIQMKVLGSKLWILELVFAALSLLGAVTVLTQVEFMLLRMPTLPYWSVLTAGILSLVSLLLAFIGIRKYEKTNNLGE